MAAGPATAVTVGSVRLPAPILTAAGTAGHGAELSAYMDLARLGAVVSKSLSARAWAGNPAPRVHPLPGGGMLNSVGLQNPGVEVWLRDDLPALRATGARVVAGIWGHTLEGYAEAADLLAAGAEDLTAVEVNLSCPNLGSPGGSGERHEMFSATTNGAAAGVRAARGARTPMWAKLGPHVPDIASIAAACLEAGAEAVTLVNTMPGMAIDLGTRRPVLGAGGGGVSGPPIHAVAVRAVWECRRALGPVPIVAAGGVASGEDAIELMLAGASAVQVGTASFREPAAAARILAEMSEWCATEGVGAVSDLIGAAHG